MHRAFVTLRRASTCAELRYPVGTRCRCRPGTCRIFRPARETRRVACFGVPPVHSRSDADAKRRPGRASSRRAAVHLCGRLAARCGSRLAFARLRLRTPLSSAGCRHRRHDLKMGSTFFRRALDATQKVSAGVRIAVGNPAGKYAAFPAKSSSTGQGEGPAVAPPKSRAEAPDGA